jgi:CBS domain-containing protein
MVTSASIAQTTSSQPSASLMANLRTELMRHTPFAQMESAHVDRFIAATQQVYYAPDETVLAPDDGVPKHLIYIRQGHITGRRGVDQAMGGFEYDAGDLFPVQLQRPTGRTKTHFVCCFR